MSRLSKIIGLSIVVASAAFISRVLRSEQRSATKNLSNKGSDENANKAKTEENEFDTRTQKMYKDLSMTESQKERYEASISALKNDWVKNNPNEIFDNEKLLSEEDKSLSAVLDEVQYGMYRDWAKKYAY